MRAENQASFSRTEVARTLQLYWGQPSINESEPSDSKLATQTADSGDFSLIRKVAFFSTLAIIIISVKSSMNLSCCVVSVTIKNPSYKNWRGGAERVSTPLSVLFKEPVEDCKEPEELLESEDEEEGFGKPVGDPIKPESTEPCFESSLLKILPE